MAYTRDALKEKILEMYPEISRSNVHLTLRFEADKDAWLIHLAKDGRGLDTHLDRKDADSCINGTVCVPLGIKVGEFVDNFARA